ncbi:MAG: putative DNA-binding domain-containing protein [Woeseiaceae bacterium]
MSLANIQYSFINNLMLSNTNPTDFIFELNAVGALTVEKQISIYRSNVSGAYQKVMSQVYPACLSILGVNYFNQLCLSYRYQYPSNNPDLNVYGEYFFDYLKKQIKLNKELTGFEYLSELAKLEWHWHSSYFSPDDERFDFEGLSLVSETDLPNLSFTLSASLSLHCSTFPIVEIWKSNKHDTAETQEFLMHDAEQCFCIFRQDFSPQLSLLSSSQYQLLRLIQNGKTLAQFSEYDCQNELMGLIEQGWVTEFSSHA